MSNLEFNGHGRRNIARDVLDRAAGNRDDMRQLVQENSAAAAVYQVAVRAIMPLLGYDFGKHIDTYADRSDMFAWAQTIMQRPPDFLIGDDEHGVYMERWHIIPRNEQMNIYLHRVLRDDGDVMHDHPWDNTSLLIDGGYFEETPEGVFTRTQGDVVYRKAADAHRLTLIGDTAISLFMTGPKVREWGFHCPGGWVDWQTFTGGKHSGRSTALNGCGELS